MYLKKLVTNFNFVQKAEKYFANISCNSRRLFQEQMNDETIEQKIPVGDFSINCLRTGVGKHNVLFIPGSLGTIWTDFSSQIIGFDLDKFSVIVWEPPGYGKSRPPERDFSLGYLERDADVAAKLIEKLGIPNCSVLGWSDGGVTGLFLAAKYANLVNKLVIWGANAYVTDEDLKIYEGIRDISNWSHSMKTTLMNIYGEKTLIKLMNEWVDSINHVLKIQDGDICKNYLSKIGAPTLIIHGMKDPLVPYFHVEYLHKCIQNSRLHRFQDAKHNIHIKYAEAFNEVVQSFLEEKEDAKCNFI